MPRVAEVTHTIENIAIRRYLRQRIEGFERFRAGFFRGDSLRVCHNIVPHPHGSSAIGMRILLAARFRPIARSNQYAPPRKLDPSQTIAFRTARGLLTSNQRQ